MLVSQCFHPCASVLFCFWWRWRRWNGKCWKEFSGKRRVSWYSKFCIALHFNKLTLSEKYCLFFECTVLSYNVDSIRNRQANADDNVRSSFCYAIKMNECESMCAILSWCVWIKERAHRITVRKIIARNSMFQPDLKKKNNRRIFCTYSILSMLWLVFDWMVLSAIIHAFALCVRVSIFLLFFVIILSRSLFQRWLNVLAPHNEIDRKAHYPTR